MVDVYRFLHDDISSFTWFKSDLTQKSRIDFWLISDNLLSFVRSCNISTAPLTDHAGIRHFECSLSKPGYWKLNTSNSDYCLGIRGIIDSFQKKNTNSYTLNWDLCKFECRNFSIKFSKELSKSKGLQYESLLKEINHITCITSPTDAEKEHLYLLREQLNTFYVEKAKGAFARSREDGEKNSAYFFNLEKKRRRYKRSYLKCV